MNVSPSPGAGPETPHLSAGLLLIFYGLMAGLALVLAWLFDLPSLWHLSDPPGHLPDGPLAWGAGLALGLAAHGLDLLARRRFDWARAFHARMAEMLGPLSRPWVVLAALTSGVAEELLFRGALLPLTGLWVQALIFGLAHLAPDRSMRWWPLYAAAMGLCFGLLYQESGSLLPAVLAHFTVNYFGLSELLSGPPKSSDAALR